MNKIVFSFLLVWCLGLFLGCEKDDICVDADTPLLIIRFFDIENRTEFKVVPNLRVIGIGNENPVDTFTDRLSTLDSIAIPLKTTEDITSFSFIIGSEDDESGEEIGKIDTVQFNYTTKEIFKSRACGFIVNYDDLETTFTPANENWIQQIEIVKSLVQTEEEVTAHVKIYH